MIVPVMAAHTVPANPNLVPVWHTLRILRWLLYLGLLAFALYFVSDRASHMDQFGQLLPLSELLIFGLGAAPVVVGLFEMMIRDWAGVPRKPPR